MDSLDEGLIGVAFQQDQHLKGRILIAIRETPQHTQLFEDIATYHQVHQTYPLANGDSTVEQNPEPASKKRKLDNGVLPMAMTAPVTANYRAVFLATDISFSIPIRKKLRLELAVDESSNSGKPKYAVSARNMASHAMEFVAELSSQSVVFYLPVPEKAQKQHNFYVVPGPGKEPLLWTVPDGPLKCLVLDSSLCPVGVEHSPNPLKATLDLMLQRSGTQRVICPSDEEFVSATPEAHRKDEKAYHVKSFRGSKDGYLFFLSTGILFGFKKPLAFFPLECIDSISYTSVLQRTFNLNIAHRVSVDDGAEAAEAEFSMLDQSDFAGIDDYIKRHELQDASMAETRRARKLKSRSDADADANVNDERTELQKAEAEAEAELDNEEDEEEEDYDPGSEGESEGSGSESEGGEEGDDGGGGGGEGDLVEEELGSEVEEVEVEVDPEDEDQL